MKKKKMVLPTKCKSLSQEEKERCNGGGRKTREELEDFWFRILRKK